MELDLSLTKLLEELSANAAKMTDDDEREMRRRRSLDRYAEWVDRMAKRLPRWRDIRFANEQWVATCSKDVVQFARDWSVLKRDGRDFHPAESVVILGRSGIGKSTALYAQLHRTFRGIRNYAEQGGEIGRLPSLMWVSEADLVAESRRFDDEMISRACEVEILILDELGTANGHTAAAGASPVIHRVLTARYDAGLRTSVTSGMTKDELLARFGSGLVRRMFHQAKSLEAFKG